MTQRAAATVWWDALRAAWQALPAPRRRLITVLLAGCAALIVGMGVLQPAWQQWHHGPQRVAQGVSTLATVQAQAAELTALREQPDHASASWDAARYERELRALSTQWLGNDARLAASDGGWEVTFQRTTAEGVARWLVGVREVLASDVRQLQAERQADGTWQGRSHVQRLGGAP